MGARHLAGLCRRPLTAEAHRIDVLVTHSFSSTMALDLCNTGPPPHGDKGRIVNAVHGQVGTMESSRAVRRFLQSLFQEALAVNALRVGSLT